MALTWAQIQTQTQRLYKESSTRWFDTNWFISASADAVEDIWDELVNVNPAYAPIKLAMISYVQGQREYTLPSDFEQTVKLEVVDIGGPPYPLLARISFEDVGEYPSLPFNIAWTTTGRGEPAAFYIRYLESGQTPIGSSTATTADVWVMGFDPIPGRTASNNVNLWYVATPNTPTAMDSSLPDLPPDFHDLIPRRLCIYMAIADQSPTLEFYKASYNDSLLRKLNRVVRGPQVGNEEISLDWGSEG